MNVLNSIYVLALLMVISCKSAKNQTSNIEENRMETQKMISDGFKKGVIVTSEKKTDCPFVIKVQGDNDTYYLDPIDLPDEFKKEGVSIWFKFTPSRRMKRCENANPVNLNDLIHMRD
jgi:hypothetical protein